MKLKKGSAAAKAYMAKIRAKRGKKKAAVGKYKKGKTTFVEVGESKPKRGKVVLVTRRKKTKPGTFKNFATIGSLKSAVSANLENEFGKLSVKHALAKTKRERSKISKQKREVLKKIKKVKNI